MGCLMAILETSTPGILGIAPLVPMLDSRKLQPCLLCHQHLSSPKASPGPPAIREPPFPVPHILTSLSP